MFMTNDMSANHKASIISNQQKTKPNHAPNLQPELTFSSDSLSRWLLQQGIERSTLDVLRAHDIDGLTFFMLTDNDLRELNLKIGTRKKLLCLAHLWQKYVFRDSPDTFSRSLSMSNVNHNVDMFTLLSQSAGDELFSSPSCSSIIFGENHSNEVRGKERRMSFSSAPATNEPLGCIVDFGNLALKLVASAVYAFCVLCLTSFVMVLAHERLPDMSKYPPLPDLLLDNLPHIPWAFKATEVVCLILLFIWVIILIFHRYRFILLRRYFSLMGTVFLLRSVTMIITSLSVPGQHLLDSCKPYYYSTLQEKINRALEISFGFGMSLQGVVTCGDYMFSGHTAVLTMLNFFITEYTPRNLHMLHTFTWVMNIFGVFFILAGHEHYSIDVFIACYISSRLFLYYHCLANNNSLMCRDKGRTRIWFPLFSFFESDVHGVVPNQFEVPLANFLINKWSQFHETFLSSTDPCTKPVKNLKTSTPQAQHMNGRSAKNR